MKCALCCDITQCVVVVSYRRFGTTYRSHLQGAGIWILTLEDGNDSLSLNVEILDPWRWDRWQAVPKRRDSWPLEKGPIVCPETSGFDP